jgi:hypothetical protein
MEIPFINSYKYGKKPYINSPFLERRHLWYSNIDANFRNQCGSSYPVCVASQSYRSHHLAHYTVVTKESNYQENTEKEV